LIITRDRCLSPLKVCVIHFKRKKSIFAQKFYTAMRILLVNTFERTGGAAVAAGRLMHALQSNGLEVKMLVRDKSTNNEDIIALKGSPLKKFRFVWERLIIFIANRFSRKRLFEVSIANTGADITKLPEFREADIIHMHWINQGMLSLRDLKKITSSGKSVVWTMHDLWPATGICHYPGSCSGYLNDCGNCPMLRKPSHKDLSFRVFRKKKQIIAGAGIDFVACSQWLKGCAEMGQLSLGNRFSSIPNPIDTKQFIPGDQQKARQELHLPTNKKLLLFGAFSVTDKRKGMDYLIKASQMLSDLSEKVELVFCGGVKEDLPAFGLKTRSLGYLTDKDTIVKMYQAVDCYVIPSLEENLPNMIMEAMACGTPCIGFNTGGIPEMIRHNQTGYIAEYRSAEDLALGIRTVLAKSEDTTFRKRIRDFILEHYAEEAVAGQYIQLYQKALSKK
jgi:glycosyltransferase involved in cell wall biosynthesis